MLKKLVVLGLPLFLLLGFAALWFDEPEPLTNRGGGETMKAIVYHDYGPPEVLRLEAIEKLLPNDDQILVKVRAAAANPLDWHCMRGIPYVVRLGNGLRKPHDLRLGVDMAGVVEAVGSRVTRFKPGDAVFGTGNGAFGEYVLASERRLAPKPAGLSFGQAAAVPVAAITVLQGLRDKGRLAAGQKVLINGADVTGVCSTRNVGLVRSLGADHVIDYKREDFAQGEARYDLIVDNVGNRSLSSYRRVLKPQGTYVLIGGGGPDAGNRIGPLASFLKSVITSPFVDQNLVTMLAETNQDDLTILKELLEAGTIRPVIDRTYLLSEVPDAIRYLEEGHARVKVIIAVQRESGS